ncbi:MAG: helix-turn-helix domain-containing protein [Gammaproteobacteria bacterium]
MRPACERLLLTLPEAAKALSVATRTVRRLIERGELPKVKVGRCVRVPAEAVQAWVDKQMRYVHNDGRAGSGVRGKENACHTDVKIVPFGGCHTPTKMARELGDLLRQPIAKRRKLLKRNGKSKGIARNTGVRNQSEHSMS